MLNHSPAPWQERPGSDFDELSVWDARNQRVANVYGAPEAANQGPQKDQLEADIRLIVNAPRMYDMLRNLMAWMSHQGFREDQLAIKVGNLLNDIEE
jgi:hypothetical protein